MLIVLIIVLALATLYFLALQGRRNHPLWKTFRHQRFCHRGYHDKPQIPENAGSTTAGVQNSTCTY